MWLPSFEVTPTYLMEFSGYCVLLKAIVHCRGRETYIVHGSLCENCIRYCDFVGDSTLSAITWLYILWYCTPSVAPCQNNGKNLPFLTTSSLCCLLVTFCQVIVSCSISVYNIWAWARARWIQWILVLQCAFVMVSWLSLKKMQKHFYAHLHPHCMFYEEKLTKISARTCTYTCICPSIMPLVSCNLCYFICTSNYFFLQWGDDKRFECNNGANRQWKNHVSYTERRGLTAIHYACAWMEGCRYAQLL